MYVVPEARGRGLARRLLAELEDSARAAGRVRMVLETGTEQPEAIALYLSSGYTPMPGFGVYRDDERSRCFAKRLLVGHQPLDGPMRMAGARGGHPADG
jgi:ribosomal protein S18 acetylase RimI-like enzyme